MEFTRRRTSGALVTLLVTNLFRPRRGLALPSMRIGVIGAGWLGGSVGRI